MLIDGTFSLTFVGVDLKLVGSSVYQDLISLFEADFLNIALRIEWILPFLVDFVEKSPKS